MTGHDIGAGKTVVVTGGAGFIGSHVVEALLAQGYAVRVVDNFAAPRREECIHAEAELVEADVRDTDAMRRAFQGAFGVCHLAALPRVQDSLDHPLETHDVNVTGALSVIIAAHEAGVSQFVFASSAAVYGNREELPMTEDTPCAPVSPYGLHKRLVEEYLALWAVLYGFSSISLRLFNVYGAHFDPTGPYALVIGKFLQAKAAGEPCTIFGDGTHTRDYVFAPDVADAFVRALEREPLGHADVINIGTGTETSVNDIARIIGCVSTYAAPRIEPARSCAAITRAKTILSWEPRTTMANGLRSLL